MERGIPRILMQCPAAAHRRAESSAWQCGAKAKTYMVALDGDLVEDVDVLRGHELLHRVAGAEGREAKERHAALAAL